MHVSRQLALFVLALAVFAATSAGAAPLRRESNSAAPAAMAIDVNGADISVSGLTPSGPAVIVAAWWRLKNNFSETGRNWRPGTADASGALRVTFHTAIPPGAVVLAIDVTTGHVETLDVAPTRFSRLEISPKHFKRDAAGEIEELAARGEQVAILLVRAREGVWGHLASDGGSADADGGQLDGLVRTLPSMMSAMGKFPPPPKKIRKNDVVVVIDPRGGVLASTEVAE